MDKVGQKILASIGSRYDLEAIRDGLAWFNEHYDEEGLEQIRQKCALGLKRTNKDEYFENYKLAMLISAPHRFDQFMQYLEIDRRPNERFYLPRRQVLLPMINSLQDLADGKIEELFLSMPPRVGKTTTAMMFMAWNMGRNTEGSNLYCSFSDTITTAFYNGMLEILTDDRTYNYRQIFPAAEIVRTDAKLETIDLERKKRYPSFTARSLYGTLNGAVDCNSVQLADDLIGGIEEALSKDRLVSAWAKVDNNYLPRAKMGAKRIWMGTRWSVYDPPGIRQEMLLNSQHFKNYKWRSINIPALNDRDESNFDYKYGVGFNTEYYRQRRASFERNNDLVSWACQFQGTPYEREGTVFAPDDLMYFNGTLPPSEPDKVFMAVDPAWGGGDFVAAPICYQYGEELYVVDVIYDSSDKSRTQPRVARAAEKWGVTRMYVEGTKTTSSFSDGINDIFKRDRYQCSIKTSLKNALGGTAMGKNKEERIFAASSDIREHMIFLEEGKRSKEYQMFMQNVFSFKIMGKNKHDDAPDSLQMAITFAFPKDTPAISVRSRVGLGL